MAVLSPYMWRLSSWCCHFRPFRAAVSINQLLHEISHLLIQPGIFFMGPLFPKLLEVPLDSDFCWSPFSSSIFGGILLGDLRPAPPCSAPRPLPAVPLGGATKIPKVSLLRYHMTFLGTTFSLSSLTRHAAAMCSSWPSSFHQRWFVFRQALCVSHHPPLALEDLWVAPPTTSIPPGPV